MSKSRTVRVWASITAIDIGELVEIAERLEDAGVDGIHVDIADGVFVPDLTFGSRVVYALTSRLTLPVEAHLMVSRPDEQVRAVADAGTSRACFHLEATRYPTRVAILARSLGVQAGLALNPASALDHLGYLGNAIDYLNILTSEPDDAGERFLPGMNERVQAARSTFGPELHIEVDGGLSPVTVGPILEAGACDIVVGRSLLSAPDLRQELQRLRAAAEVPEPRSVP